MASVATRPRSTTRKPPISYECRVVRSVAANQPELAGPLRLLKENTSNFVNYKWKESGKELGRLGVTLVMLEPVLRQILTKNRRGAIRREDVLTFETELREGMEHAQFENYDIPLDQFSQLALYGRNKQYLGLQLSQRDYRMAADRTMVESYIRDNYDRADGEVVSKRFLARNLRRMEPHITIGEIDYAALMYRDEDGVMAAEKLQADPSSFVFDQAHKRMELHAQEFGANFEPETIVLPDHVTLNGLKIFCQQRN